MKHLLLLFALTAPLAAHPHGDDELPLNTASELRDWCKSESEAVFVGRGEQAFNWTASHVERGNTFHVEGRWRVNGEDVAVECRVARGARREYAVLSINGRT